MGRAMGLSNNAIHFGHALKNTLVPVMTIVGLQLGGLIAFATPTRPSRHPAARPCANASR